MPMPIPGDTDADPGGTDADADILALPMLTVSVQAPVERCVTVPTPPKLLQVRWTIQTRTGLNFCPSPR